MQKKITKKTTLEEILKLPKAEEILKKYNVPCLFCPKMVYETGRLQIGEIAKMYDLDLENLLKELSKI